MLAGGREKRVANHALVGGVLRNGSRGVAFEFAHFLPDGRGDFGPAARQFIERERKPLLGRIGVQFRQAQKAHCEIGEPITVFAEGGAGLIGQLTEPGQFGGLCDRTRIGGQLCRRIEGHCRQDGNQDRTNDQYPGLDT